MTPRLAALAALAMAPLFVPRVTLAQPAVVPAQAFAPPAWSERATIYEVNLRQYTPEGTIAAFRKELPRLRALGADILWFMPVQPIGKVERKGALGSYYSIADYVAVNPEFGTLDDFKAMVADAHRLGFKVILDWVANHTAFDHPWTRAHPDWYVRRPDGSISRAVDQDGKETDWSDVAQLDYRNRQLREAMIGEMAFWLRETGIDGFRADVAFFLPDDFWAEATARLRALRPDVFLLAEAEKPSLHTVGFHAGYAWELHHLLNAVATRKKPVGALDEWLAWEAARFPAGAYRMAFTSNHDENSWNGTEFERMGANHRPAFVLAATLRGTMPLVYSGQELGNDRRLRFFDKDTLARRDPGAAAFYASMFDLKHRNVALANGAAGGAHVPLALEGEDRAWGFVRARGANHVLVVTNFADAPARVRLRGDAAAGRWRDWSTGRSVTLRPGAALDVGANGWRILVRGADPARAARR